MNDTATLITKRPQPTRTYLLMSPKLICHPLSLVGTCTSGLIRQAGRLKGLFYGNRKQSRLVSPLGSARAE